MEARGEATQVAAADKLVKMKPFVLFDGHCFKKEISILFLFFFNGQTKSVLIPHVPIKRRAQL